MPTLARGRQMLAHPDRHKTPIQPSGRRREAVFSMPPQLATNCDCAHTLVRGNLRDVRACAGSREQGAVLGRVVGQVVTCECARSSKVARQTANLLASKG